LAICGGAYSSADNDKPVEAHIVYKQVGDKVEEVVIIKTASGKTYEIYPTVAPNQIPKPESNLSISKKTLLVVVLFGLLAVVGVGVFWWLLRREREGP
jgi:hypothetical protein